MFPLPTGAFYGLAEYKKKIEYLPPSSLHLNVGSTGTLSMTGKFTVCLTPRHLLTESKFMYLVRPPPQMETSGNLKTLMLEKVRVIKKF